MIFNYSFAKDSSVTSGADRTEMSFAPDVTRPPTYFSGELRLATTFREAISALHDVVVSDLRFKPKDKSAYKQWLAENEDALVRQMAITALGEIGDARATERLRRALSDERCEVRFQAAIAFPRVTASPEAAIEALVQATHDADPLVCHIALRMAEEVSLGAGGRLNAAGPSLVIAYAVCGFFAFLILRALGELVLHRPSSGSFVSYAREFFGEDAWLNFPDGAGEAGEVDPATPAAA